jgi:hypothetical protein
LNCRAVLRVALNGQVYVVVRNLQRQTLVFEVVSGLTKQLSHIVFNYIGVAVLMTPDKVILAGTN